MNVIKNASDRLETTGTWADSDALQAVHRANIAAMRGVLRSMLEGNVQFHVDPMAAPVTPVTAPTPQPVPQLAAKIQVVGYLCWLFPSTSGRTQGKVYPILSRRGQTGIRFDDGQLKLLPTESWYRVLGDMQTSGRVMLCDAEGK